MNSRTDGAAPATGLASFRSAQELAERFHEAYERLAPDFGYTTRPETRTLDLQSANGRLMTAMCQDILAAQAAIPPATEGAPTEREQTLAGLLKRCARCLPPEHATRKLATEYLKAQGFFNPLRASGVQADRGGSDAS